MFVAKKERDRAAEAAKAAEQQKQQISIEENVRMFFFSEFSKNY